MILAWGEAETGGPQELDGPSVQPTGEHQLQ